MPSTFLNAIESPALLFRLLKNLQQQKKFMQQHILPLLDDAKKNNDGSLDGEDFKKITHYYGLAVPAILGEAFCQLRGNAMTDKERIASTCQGAITGLGDDFFDKNRMGEAELKSFLERPQDFNGKTSAEKLFLHFYKTVLTNTDNPQQVQRRLYDVYFAQVKSKLQSKNLADKEAIKNITVAKGGTSLVFYRSVFSNTLNIDEEKMLYQLGGVMQIGNDIFDVYKDVQSGVNTLVSTAENIEPVRILFKQLMNQGYGLAFACGYKKSNVKKFIGIISLGIFSRCLVCLDHLEKTEVLLDNKFIPSLCSRQQLICDMDTAGGKWASLKYHIRTAV
jgi:hypothetical protein